jgi:cytochrome c556
MNRLLVLTGVLAFAVILTTTGLQAQDDKDIKIKDVMKQHVKGGLRAKVTEAVKDKEWDTASSSAKQWAKLASALTKATPPKGDEKSWKKLAGNYEKNVKSLAAAADSKDEKKANAALKAIGGSCSGCHKAHKGK